MCFQESGGVIDAAVDDGICNLTMLSATGLDTAGMLFRRHQNFSEHLLRNPLHLAEQFLIAEELTEQSMKLCVKLHRTLNVALSRTEFLLIEIGPQLCDLLRIQLPAEAIIGEGLQAQSHLKQVENLADSELSDNNASLGRDVDKSFAFQSLER
jgi:hypothetical protein